jgi:hypothetical protein
MITGPNTKPAEGNRENLVNALRDEALIKQLAAEIYSHVKAIDVLHTWATCALTASKVLAERSQIH